MRKSKHRFYGVMVWSIAITLCATTFIIALHTFGMIMAPQRTVKLENTASIVKDVVPIGELYLISAIQEDYVISTDSEVQDVLTTFNVNLKQNVVGTSDPDRSVDCSRSHLEEIRRTVAYNNSIGHYAENLDLKRLMTLCEAEQKQREAEQNRVFIITLSERCDYYIDFSDAEHAPSIEDAGGYPAIRYDSGALKVKCLPQKIQFLSNGEDYWAQQADDRPIDQIKGLLDQRMVARFTEKYRESAMNNVADAMKSLFCAMKYKQIGINGQVEPCATH